MEYEATERWGAYIFGYVAGGLSVAGILTLVATVYFWLR